MPISQNLIFKGDAPPDKEFETPAGASIIRMLEIGLKEKGWAVSEFDNWRDCGWSVSCIQGAEELEVILSQIEEKLQATPIQTPNFFTRLFRKTPSTKPDQVLLLAKDIHDILSLDEKYTDFNWRDCGWSVSCIQGAEELEVILSQIEENDWMLQATPIQTPNFFATFLADFFTDFFVFLLIISPLVEF